MTSRANTSLLPRLVPCLVVLLLIAGLGLEAHGQAPSNDDVTMEDVPLDGPYRPQYHLHPPRGWMGDPSGLVYADGLFHHFSWDHATSPDLVHWSHQPRALENVMSGSVVVDSANTSGFGSPDNPPWIALFSLLDPETLRQTQGLAYSLDDGTTWTKYEGNPVLDIESTEFRDPQVVWHDETERWIMVIALAEAHRVQFYASDDLKTWTHLSDFGPAGATRGVWECPDLFELPVEGTDETRWVLEVDVQPIGGQYFVGTFDGTSFHLDPDFADDLRPTQDVPPPGRVIQDFEGPDFGHWTQTGTAFGNGPANGAVDRQTPVVNFEGTGLANSFHGGDEPTGTLTSTAFTIDRPYVAFKIGGGEHLGETGAELVVDRRVVRTATGQNMETLHWRSWDVRDLMGQTARFRIVDRATGGWGHVNVDHVMLADRPAATERQSAFWIDYGMDFYAVRSWHGMPPSDQRRIWMAWMGDWRYAHLVPTETWKGVQSIPRSLSLVRTENGPRLTQQPVSELKTLRKDGFTLENEKVNGTLDLTAEHGVSGRSLEIIATIDPGDADALGLELARNDSTATTVGTRLEETDVVFIDRTRPDGPAISDTYSGIHSGPLVRDEDGLVRLHIFLDHASVEVFAGNGRTTLSNLLYGPPESDGLAIYARGGSAELIELQVYSLASVW